MKVVEDFVANNTVDRSVKQFFKPSDPESLLLDKKDISNVKAKLQREKRGNRPSANTVDQLQVVQSQLQSKPYLKRFIQRQGYAPCIILGENFEYKLTIIIILFLAASLGTNRPEILCKS